MKSLQSILQQCGLGLMLFFALLLPVLLFGTTANGQDSPPDDTGSRIGRNQHVLMSNGRVQLAPGWDGKIDSYTNCQKKPEGDQIYYSLADADTGCTVELFVDEKQEHIEFQAIIESGTALLDCLTEEVADNTLPFIYGKDNEYLKKIAIGPEEDPDACVKGKECNTYNGKTAPCMKSTSLEVMWAVHSVRENEYDLGGDLHPVGETTFPTGIHISFNPIEPDQMSSAMIVKIERQEDGTGKFKLNNVGNVGDSTTSNILKLACISMMNAVPPPIFWPILDQQGNEIEGKKKLLTFNLLPVKASRRVVGWNAEPEVPPNKPKCKLSFKFASKMFQPLTAEGLGITANPVLTTTTTTIETTSTTTITETTTEIETSPTATTTVSTSTVSMSPPTTSTMRTTQSGSSKSTTQSGFSNGTTTQKHGPGNGGQNPEGNLIWVILAIVGGVLLLAIIGFLLVWFIACRGKKDADSGEEEEAEDGAAASGDPKRSDICINTAYTEQQESTTFVDTALTTPDTTPDSGSRS